MYNEDFEKEVCALYIEIGNIKSVAGQAGLSIDKCRGILARHGYLDTSHRPETQAKYDMLCADFLSGADPAEIAAAYSIPYSYVSMVLKDQGLDPGAANRARRERNKAARIAAFLDAWTDGNTLQEIAGQFGVALSTAAHYLTQAGVSWREVWGLPPKGPKPGPELSQKTKDIRQAILDAREKNLPLLDIARAFSVSRQYVYQVADGMGLRPGKAVLRAKQELRAESLPAFIKDYSAGMTMKELCGKYHMSPVSARKALQENGIVPRKPGKKPGMKGDTNV